MDLSAFLQHNRILLPPGDYINLEPIREPGLTITSADPKQPARVKQLHVYADNVTVEQLCFPALTDALILRGHQCQVRACTFKGNQTAILAEKTCLIEHNVIVGFAQDGIRFCGNGTVIVHNILGLLNTQDMTDSAHHDCIQGWAGDPNSPFRSAGRYEACHSLEGVLIQHNTLFDLPDSPLQGITFFDGLGLDWEVTDNHIALPGPHPLTLLGQRATLLVRNQLPYGEALLLPARRWQAATQRWETVVV